MQHKAAAFLQELQRPVRDYEVLASGFLIRNGFVFCLGNMAAVYDTLLIRWPEDATAIGYRFGFSERSLEEHIQFIREYEIRKAVIVCRDLSFLPRCQNLGEVTIVPSENAEPDFDYSPLYKLPNLRMVNCITEYGPKGQFHATVDYRKIPGVAQISAAGKGHLGYEAIPNLEVLSLCRDQRHTDFSNISCSNVLREAFFLQCRLKSLEGLEQHPGLEELTLSHCRSIQDISQMRNAAAHLRILTIENCPKIQDFSVLEQLHHLEHLQLYGSQTLPNLVFLKQMPRLKTFVFTMNVADGNLLPCMEIPYASCKNRKHFNRKDVQLPKNLHTTE